MFVCKYPYTFFIYIFLNILYLYVFKTVMLSAFLFAFKYCLPQNYVLRKCMIDMIVNTALCAVMRENNAFVATS